MILNKEHTLKVLKTKAGPFLKKGLISFYYETILENCSKREFHSLEIRGNRTKEGKKLSIRPVDASWNPHMMLKRYFRSSRQHCSVNFRWWGKGAAPKFIGAFF